MTVYIELFGECVEIKTSKTSHDTYMNYVH